MNNNINNKQQPLIKPILPTSIIKDTGIKKPSTIALPQDDDDDNNDYEGEDYEDDNFDEEEQENLKVRLTITQTFHN